MYTHCPNCNTHFSITQEYLDIANGKVRCGKCDYVFNALENLYNNEAQAPSPPLETAVSTSQEEQTTTVDQDTPGTDINSSEDTPLPEPEPPTDSLSSDEETEARQTQEPEQTQEQSQEDPVVNIQTPFSPPLASIDIKEKMERIAASLSAATQELKNARQSVGFERSAAPTGQTITTPEPQEEVEIETPASSNEPEPETQTETETEATDLGTASEVAEVSDKDLADSEEDTAKINTRDIISTDTDEVLESPEPVADTNEPAPEPDPVAPSEEQQEEQEEQSATPPELEDELDLVDFSDTLETDDTLEQTPPTDFNPAPVDESDLDILNSLIETQEHGTGAPDSLIEELNDINKSLSNEDISLDDELSQIESEIDQELGSDDDILKELEQLDKEFQYTGSDTDPDTALEPSDNEIDHEAALAPDLNTTQQQSVPTVEEEVVPSFLTQGSSKSSSPATMFGWLFATLLMLGLLGAQYLHFNSLKLADNPDYRPFLETLCPITGCILPLRKAPEKIITINHDVHTHPSVKDALEIELSFRNKAGFTQQYPVLEVIFSNPRGEVIARRKFSPDEYLDHKIPYIAGIKPNQTEKIDLQIVDPDPGALLSFQFNYL